MQRRERILNSALHTPFFFQPRQKHAGDIGGIDVGAMLFAFKFQIEQFE